MLDVKEILSRNVGKLLETKQDVSRLNLSRQMKVADGTLGRIKYGTGNPNAETIEAIARFFRFQSWQLLVEGFDPQRPPALISAEQMPDGLTEDERELIRVVRLLREPERTYLFKQARSYMETMEATHDVADKSRTAEKNGTHDAKPGTNSPLWGTW